MTRPLMSSIERSTFFVSNPPIRVQQRSSLKPYSLIRPVSFSVQWSTSPQTINGLAARSSKFKASAVPRVWV